MEMFAGRKLIIATMHGKETVIGPLLATNLGIIPQAASGLNTDDYGTFSREVKRPDNALNTARQKCKAALLNAEASLVVGSEGSFGQHPFMLGTAINEEWVLLLDSDNKIEIYGYALSMDTNFRQGYVTNWQSLEEFAQEIGFPDHGIILSTNDKLEKNIGPNWSELQRVYKRLAKENPQVFAETDMRAMRNPARQKVIYQATLNLLEKIKTPCPACAMPGFGIIDTKAGLPCRQCHNPTDSVCYTIKGCQVCGHKEKERVEASYENPQYCNFCNP
jgi:hypothetical protein